MKIKDVKQLKKLLIGRTIQDAEYDTEARLFVVHLDNASVLVMDLSSIAVAQKAKNA